MEKMENEKPVKAARWVNWLKPVIALLSFLVLSFGLAYILENLSDRFQLPLYDYAWLAYLIVFTTSLVANLTILVLVPFAASFMVSAAMQWNPIMVALVASIGGTIGELSSYSVGYLGKKLAVMKENVWFKKVEGWTKRYGMWAISLK